MNHPYHHGKRLRLPHYDYSQAGAYFVTLCTKDRLPILSRIQPGDELHAPAVYLSSFGVIVETAIRQISTRYPGVKVDAFAIMPNHVHLLLQLPPDGGPALGKIIQQLKGFVTKQCGQPIWQDKYHDHVIRNDADYSARYQYIANNPSKWAEDEYYSSSPYTPAT